MADISRYDQGITEIPQLLEEIHAYANTKLGGEDKTVEVQIKEENGFITFYVYEEGALVIEKRMIFLINKYDLVND
jgi:hypothetical protein